MDDAEVLDELYGLLPADFTRVRDERARQAKARGYRELAETLRKLRRPTASAWALNLLVRRYPEQVDELIGIGARLRQAQTDLDGAAVRELGARRRQAVAALARQARSLGVELGQRLTDAALIELEQTLLAALVDPAAAHTVRAGRMSAPLAYAGLGPLAMPAGAPPVLPRPAPQSRGWPELADPEDPLADWPPPLGSGPPPAIRAVQVERPAPADLNGGADADRNGHGGGAGPALGLRPAPDARSAAERHADEQRLLAAQQAREDRLRADGQRRAADAERRHRALEEARQALRDADRDAAEAAAALADAQGRLDRAGTRSEDLDSRVVRLTEQLRELEEQALHASRDLRAARHSREAAVHADQIARRAAERARTEVERLERRSR